MSDDFSLLADVKEWAELIDLSITSISLANPGIVTIPNHGFRTGMHITFSGLSGMTQLNGQTARIIVIDSNTFSIGIDTRAYTAYTAGTGFLHPDDYFIASLIDGIVSAVEKEIHGKIVAATDQIAYFDGGRHFLVLPHLNISDVGVYYDVSRVFASSALLDSTDYVVNAEGGTILVSREASNWNYDRYTFGSHGSFQTVKVTYDGGYSAANIDSDLKVAIVMQSAYVYRRRSDLGMSAKTFHDGSFTLKMSTDEFLPEVKDKLGRFRRDIV
jgi:hypothetical protein